MSKAKKLTYAKSFLNEKFEDYAKKLQVEYSSNMKFLLDLNQHESDCFRIFYDKHFVDLRSRNKSSANFEEKNEQLRIRKQYFINNKIYHHHLIDNDTYNNAYCNNQSVIKKRGMVKVPLEKSIKTISDHIEEDYHVSNLCIHYQIIETEYEIEYKVLFISPHPKGKEWDETKDNINLTLTGEANE